MPTCAGVAFKRVSRSYWFSTGGLDLCERQTVVADTQRGLELGTVRVAPRDVRDDELDAPLRSIARIATEQDLAVASDNRKYGDRLLDHCRLLATQLQVPMRVLHVEVSLDRSHITVYFAADSRVDFREFVRQLALYAGAGVLCYQLGARDQARLLGGVGSCGRPLCCASFLTEFEPVSVRMAKDQSLFQNPVRFAGVCGKLMCCLRYEQDSYSDTQQSITIGALVSSELGDGIVVGFDAVNEVVSLRLAKSDEVAVLSADKVNVLRGGQCTSCKHKHQHSIGEDRELDQDELEEGY